MKLQRKQLMCSDAGTVLCEMRESETEMRKIDAEIKTLVMTARRLTSGETHEALKTPGVQSEAPVSCAPAVVFNSEIRAFKS